MTPDSKALIIKPKPSLDNWSALIIIKYKCVQCFIFSLHESDTMFVRFQESFEADDPLGGLSKSTMEYGHPKTHRIASSGTL